MVIPAHTYVQGMVEAEERPGHVKRTSEFRFRFTTLDFASNFVAPINGVLQSIPGARNIRARDKDGLLVTVDQTEKAVAPAAVGAVSGAIIGADHSLGIGKFTGAAWALLWGWGSVLLKRGDEISLATGTRIEMILQAPLSLEQAQIARKRRYTLHHQRRSRNSKILQPLTTSMTKNANLSTGAGCLVCLDCCVLTEYSSFWFQCTRKTILNQHRPHYQPKGKKGPLRAGLYPSLRLISYS